jgi:hypothetical protein
MPTGEIASNRSDIELLFDKLPEPIDLEIDTDNEMLYWTDRGEYPFGNTLNRAFVGLQQVVKGDSLKPEILSRHLHEVRIGFHNIDIIRKFAKLWLNIQAIGLRIDHVNKHIYFTDLGGSVYRSDLNGKNKQTLCNVGAAFTGIALTHVG